MYWFSVSLEEDFEEDLGGGVEEEGTGDSLARLERLEEIRLVTACLFFSVCSDCSAATLRRESIAV